MEASGQKDKVTQENNLKAEGSGSTTKIDFQEKERFSVDQEPNVSLPFWKSIIKEDSIGGKSIDILKKSFPKNMLL
jgi:hypothetical protein